MLKKSILQTVLKKVNGLKPKYNNSKRIIVLMGLLGDLDSFEYAQLLIKNLDKLNELNINLLVFGIGDDSSKKKFCEYTQFPSDLLEVLPNLEFHEKVNCYPGLRSSLGQIVGILGMCAGVGSLGTLKEVIRGYMGDRNSNKIFSPDQEIKIPFLPKISGNVFQYAGDQNTLRPFELASLRLLNMIEVISNWNIYMHKQDYLTQRGATLLINEKDHLIYSYFPKGLLQYSSTMSQPLDFIDRFKLSIKSQIV